MSTPSEVIDRVEDFFSRPDLHDRILARFPKALQSAHSVDKFRRDLKTIYITNPAIFSGVVNIPLTTSLPRLRKVREILCYSSFTLDGVTVVPGTLIPNYSLEGGFRDLTDAASNFNYYGFRYPQTYAIAGNILNLAGVDSTSLAIGVAGVYYPSYTFNAISGEYETDSWLMVESDDIVEAYLRLYVAQIIQNDKQIAGMQTNLMMARAELIKSYEQELLK